MMYSIFLVRGERKEFYCVVDQSLPEDMFTEVIDLIRKKEGCDIFVRWVSPSGVLMEVYHRETSVNTIME